MTNDVATDVNNQEPVNLEANSEDQSQNQDQQKTDANSKEMNFAKLREKSEAAERKSAELERQMKELLRREEERNRPAPVQEEDELSSLADDDIITVKQATKLATRKAEELIKQKLEQSEKAQLPQKTRSTYGDFDAIMTEENIRKLETEEPGLADACSKAVNPWEATYKILKKFVLPQQEVKASKADEKMKENLSAPASSNSVGRQGPLSNANAWSEASRDDLYKEMIQSARSAR
jgi:hypothetical protein